MARKQREVPEILFKEEGKAVLFKDPVRTTQ
jgi:hypothetical protein